MRKWSIRGRLKRPVVSRVAVCALWLSAMVAPAAAVAPPGVADAGRAAVAATDQADVVKMSQRVRKLIQRVRELIRLADVVKMSQSVRELIRLVEKSDLLCEIRNELVERLRLLDDELRSGRLTAARALVTAWRAWVAERAATGLLSASISDAVEQRLAPLVGQIGLGWPEEPRPVRNWPKLPVCDAASAGVAGAAATETLTWDSNKTLTVLTTAAQMLPGPIGDLFAGEIALMWPAGETVDVTQIVDQEILEYALAQSGADLAAIEEENRQYWQPALEVWLTECGWTESAPPNWEPPLGCGSADARLRVTTAWDNMFADLVRTATAMQVNSGEVDYRDDLLPLYVQVENLLIAHLQLGVLNRANWWPNSPDTQKTVVDTLQMHIETEPGDPPQVGDPIDPNYPDFTGVGYVEQVYEDMVMSNDPDVTDYPVRTDGGRLDIADWKVRNAWARDHGTIQGLYFSDIWPFMDPLAYPNGNPDYRQTRIIYTDPIGYENHFWHLYPDLDPSDNVSPVAPANVSGPLGRLEVWQDDSVGYLENRSVIDAVRVTPEGGTASAIMGDPNPAGIGWNWTVGLSTEDPALMPIVKVHVAEGYQSYNDPDANVHWPQGFELTFLDGGIGSVGSFTTTGIDGKPLQDTKLHFYDYVYDGQVLATVKVLDVHEWTDNFGNVDDISADCVMFGFRFADSF